MSTMVDPVKAYLLSLQKNILTSLAERDPSITEAGDEWQREAGGGGITRVISGGDIFDKAGVNFSHVHGSQLPPSASASRPELAGRGFEAMGVSLVIHPVNPHVPTTHANVRFFIAEKAGEAPVWWFGGGFDLTPCYGYDEDVLHWHRTAKAACDPFGESVYDRYRKWCDEYFYLPHRGETRGVGGLFFDDLNQPDFEQSFAFMRSVGDHFLPAYMPIVERRHKQAWTDSEKQWQEYRRARYVEFNLVYDRGTLFGLQSGGRTESILMSLPPVARWAYEYRPEPDSAEELLINDYLRPRDWLSELAQV